MIRYFFIGLLLLLALYILLVAGIYSFQSKIIFQPESLASDYSYSFDQPFEEHFLVTADSSLINALYFRTPNLKKGAVLYFHGNADNLQRWGQYQKEFTRRGYDTFVMDYRGYGKSTGEIEEETMYRDAELAYQWLLQRFEAEEIIIYGRSLGTAIAANLASKVKARMLILETPFDNMPNLIKKKLPDFMVPFNMQYIFPTRQFLQNVPYPIYIFHGTADDVVPYEEAIRLKEVLKPGDNFFTLEGGGHRGLSNFTIYQEQLDRLLGIDEFEPKPSTNE